jgi:hypothetical protein
MSGKLAEYRTAETASEPSSRRDFRESVRPLSVQESRNATGTLSYPAREKRYVIRPCFVRPELYVDVLSIFIRAKHCPPRKPGESPRQLRSLRMIAKDDR